MAHAHASSWLWWAIVLFWMLRRMCKRLRPNHKFAKSSKVSNDQDQGFCFQPDASTAFAFNGCAFPARVVGRIRKPCSHGWHFKQKHSSAASCARRWCQLMGEHGLLYIPVHAKSRRKKRKRARKKETDLSSQPVSKFPPLLLHLFV